MNRYGLALLVMLVPAGVALADAYVELVPTPAGPYHGGETVHVDLNVWQDTGEDMELRCVQFAFYNTAPALDVTGFEFDVSTIDPGLYFVEPDWYWPHVAIGYMGLHPLPGHMLTLSGDASALHVAEFEVLLPPALAAPLVLDVMNYDDIDPDFGARLIAGFGLDPDDPRIDWRAYDGVLHGGVLEFVPNPEPGMLALLLVGASCISPGLRCRRRGAR